MGGSCSLKGWWEGQESFPQNIFERKESASKKASCRFCSHPAVAPGNAGFVVNVLTLEFGVPE